MSNILPLTVEINADEITVSTSKGIEVCHWIRNEWEEDLSVTPVIADAVEMAYANPKRLLRLHMEHIIPQLLGF